MPSHGLSIKKYTYIPISNLLKPKLVTSACLFRLFFQLFLRRLKKIRKRQEALGTSLTETTLAENYASVVFFVICRHFNSAPRFLYMYMSTINKEIIIIIIIMPGNDYYMRVAAYYWKHCFHPMCVWYYIDVEAMSRMLLRREYVVGWFIVEPLVHLCDLGVSGFSWRRNDVV